MMCDAGEYFIWVLAVLYFVLFIFNLRLRNRLLVQEREMEQRRQVWDQRLEEVHRMKDEARALRDKWKVAMMISDSTLSQQAFDDGES